jgi:Secretion system C-terminal sorting domain/G8 domain
MKLILPAILLLACIHTHAQSTIVSNGSGAWSSSSTWNLNRIPGDGDIVVINNNNQVILNENIVLNNVVLRVQGALMVNDNKTLNLNGNGIINIVTGGKIIAVNKLANSIISIDGVAKFRGNKIFNPSWGEGFVAGLANASLTTGDIDLGGPGFVMGALPATWQDLNVFRTIDNMVQMVWVTSHETGTRIFDVERSGEALQWIKIGTINSAGNQGQVNIYDFVDSKPLTGINYYRILQKDPDGKTKYTSVRFISITAKEFSVKGYPNPAVSNYRVDFSFPLAEPLQLNMVNSEGKMLMKKTAGKGCSYMDLPVRELRTGIYFIQCMTSNGNIHILKMVRGG